MSAGTAKPTTWPRWRFPAAYGQAGATRIFCLLFVFVANRLLRLGEGHDTSHLSKAQATPGHHEARAKREKSEPERDQQVPAALRRRDTRLVPCPAHRRGI